MDIEHASLIRTISTYQAELEELGVFRFQIGKPPKGSRGGRPETYALLNEDQAIFLATLSRNTRQVVDFKLTLTKAFALARQQLQTPSSSLNRLWDERARLFNEKTCIPAGYWCIFHEIAHVCWGMEFRGAHLREDAVPDISIGKLWCKYARERGMDLSYEIRLKSAYFHECSGERQGRRYIHKP